MKGGVCMLDNIYAYIIAFSVEKDDDGSYYATCPGLHGVHVSGDTPEEALLLAQKDVETILEIRFMMGETLPESEHIIALRKPDPIPLRTFKQDSVLFPIPPHLAKILTERESTL